MGDAPTGGVVKTKAVPPRLIDADAAVERICKMQSKTTVKNTDAWYAINRTLHVLWAMADEVKP